MEIIPFNKKYVKEISRLMLKDLENPPKQFSEKMIAKFIGHAKEEEIIKEFEKSNLIGFLAIDDGEVVGFIVGYSEGLNHSVIHYITGDTKKTKKLLLDKFIQYCRNKKMEFIKTDSFKFMDNHNFFEENGFKIIDKEELEEGITLFWRRLNVE